jgi:hypothetical protein
MWEFISQTSPRILHERFLLYITSYKRGDAMKIFYVTDLSVKYMIYDMLYLLTAFGLPPGGSSTVHIYIQTIHRTTQNKQYKEQQKKFGRMRAVHRLCELYPGICLTTEEKARKNLSQGS